MSRTSQNSAAELWASLGAPKHKIVIGIAMYGRGFSMKNPTQYEVGSGIKTVSKAFAYTLTAGMFAYYEVRHRLCMRCSCIHCRQFVMPDVIAITKR